MTPTTAMVLAAGFGTRMRPLTDNRPKPLIEVGGRALIDHMLDRLIEAGVTRVVVNVHYCADQLEAHVRRRRDVEVLISDERAQLLETGGGVRKALDLLGTAPIFVCNTDSIWDEDTPGAVRALAEGFDPSRMGARLLLADISRSLGFDGAGDFMRDADGRLHQRGEAPSAPFAYTGVQIVDPMLLADERVEPFSFMRIWRRLIDDGRLHGAVLDGFWMHVGDPIALAAAERRLAAPPRPG